MLLYDNDGSICRFSHLVLLNESKIVVVVVLVVVDGADNFFF